MSRKVATPEPPRRGGAMGWTVHYRPSWQRRPFRDPATCRHDPVGALVIGQRIERARDRSRSALACDCRICMDCGAVVHGGQTFIEAMQLAWDEYGWNRIIGQRIYAVIRHRRMDLEGKVVPAWFAIGALGWNGREVMRLCDAYAASRGRKSHRPPGRAKDQVGQGQARPGPTESGAGV